MSLYLKSIKQDLTGGDDFNILLNNADALREGINDGDQLTIAYGENVINVNAYLTGTEVAEGYVGIYSEIWEKNEIPNDTEISIFRSEPSPSIDIIRKKILGKKLTEDEIRIVMKDMGERRIGQIETAFWMGTFFNPGFDDDETLWMAKTMAEVGDVLSFNNLHDNGSLVVDKHSIGGVAGKAVTPIIVPLIAACGLVIPNTSTRAITSPAGTSDILETVMPVTLSKEEIMEVVKKNGACLVWGGALDLAPADDVLIHVERVIHLESYQKILVSIVAKKISMGISHIVIDVPYGEGTKVRTIEDAHMIKREFNKLFSKLGIKSEVLLRKSLGPDGKRIGPNLEMIDVLKILEQREDRAQNLEKLALDMAGALLELADKAPRGKGYDMALEKLRDGSTLKKFWDIAKSQGATIEVKSDGIKTGEYSVKILSIKSGKITRIDNKEIMKLSRMLGTPTIKDAGMYFNYTVGDTVKEGDHLLTLYSSAQSRIESAKLSIDLDKLLDIS